MIFEKKQVLKKYQLECNDLSVFGSAKKIIIL